LRESLVSLAIESWRLSRTFKALLDKSDTEQQRKYSGKLSWFNKRLQETLQDADLEMVDLENHKFDTGMAARAINLDEFEGNEELVVDKMLEPIIMASGEVLKRGTITLRRLEQ
tara:strand:+ start:267 stop:608 length:342 start_codon:yes stop_codon:yes gene_type:complete